MANNITTYQCPNCMGSLQFNPKNGMLTCDFCGSSFDPKQFEDSLQDDLEQAAANFRKSNPDHGDSSVHTKARASATADDPDEWNTDSAGEDWDAAQEGMTCYKCPKCTAEILTDDTTASLCCPYCGNQSVVPGQVSGMLKPDLILPFKVTKDEAIEGLRKHYHSRKFVPSVFTSQNHVQKIQGVYVPFWLYSCRALGRVDMDATIVSTYIAGDNQVTDTQHFDLVRQGTLDFDRVPVDGSHEMPDDYMDSIEPFDYSELVEFSTAYLPGYLANRYDMDADDCSKRADQRVAASVLEQLSSYDVSRYTTCEVKDQQVKLKRGDVEYALLPIWLLSTTCDGKDYLFAMNGQTGKMVGDMPVDKAGFAKQSILIALAIAVVAFILLFFLMS